MSSSISNQKPFLSPEVRVVEASAGSGKTYALAKRYVQLILSSPPDDGQIPIRNILALTFTNKAAFEMKSRILEFLKTIALKQLSPLQERDICAPLGLNRDQAGARAYAAMEAIIRHYNFFQVQTIDKFINALLSGCAFKIGLTANFKIKTNAGEYLQYSLDRLIDKARVDKNTFDAFQDFLHHYLYLENRSGWFPKDDILAIITTLFEQSNAYGADFRESPIAREDVLKVKRMLASEIKVLQKILPTQTHAGFAKAIVKFVEKSEKGFDIDSISDYFTREAVPVKKGGEVSDEVVRSWRKIKKYITRLCEGEAQSLFNPYIMMFAQAIEGFYTLAAKDDCLFLSELNKRAGLLFDDNHITVEELYYRLATRFGHYLIDEFQDTSFLQWHNLEKMTEEALSTGGTLFYVGDRKQAIYGFRGGDAALFDQVKKGFEPFNVQLDFLSNNWRSQKAIVEFNNTIFSPENLTRFIRQKDAYQIEKSKKTMVHFTEGEIEEINNVFEESHQIYQEENNEGYVRIEHIDIDKKEERDIILRQKIIDLIGDLHRRFSYRDIAILTRGNKQVKDITNWLLEAGIPVDSERTSDIRENSLVQEMIAFFQFLHSPVDNQAFTGFIFGEIFVRSTGKSSEEMHGFVFGLRQRLVEEKDVYVYTEFRKQYPEIWKRFFEEFFLGVGLYPLYELVITIYKRFHVLTNCQGSQGFLMHLLELVKKSEEDHLDVGGFLQYFDNIKGEDLYVRITGHDAVKVLTIHKAKGLEFPVVIFPYIGMDVQVGSKGGEYQPAYVLQREISHMGLLRIKSKYRKFSPDLEAVYAREYRKSFLCELNNIYVALTRPKNELYGFIPKRIGNNFNFAQFLIPEDLYVQGELKEYKTIKPKGKKPLDISPAFYPDWIEYLKDEFLNTDQRQSRDKRLHGEVMHYALSLIGNLDERDSKEIIESALRETQMQFEPLENMEFYQDKIKALLSHEDMKRFFYCGQGDVFTEREVVNALGHTKRCDRLIIYKDVAWVVDFKSTKNNQERDQKQIRGYQQIRKET